LLEDEENRIVLKPLPMPAEAFSSLKYLFPDKTAKEIVEEGRKRDYERDKRLLRLVGSSDVTLNQSLPSFWVSPALDRLKPSYKNSS
jgi:hypothetical protein